MQKRGQFQISFGMIFSIIIIIAIIGVAFYAISSFLSLSNCSKIGIFYNDLKTYIEKAWQATIHEDTLTAILPSGIESVCFGDLTQSPSRKYTREYNEFLKLNKKTSNVFLYPPEKACDFSLSSIKLEHIKSPEFFCLPIKTGKVEIKTKRGEFDSLVEIIQ